MSLKVSIIAGEALLEPVEIKDKNLSSEVGSIATQIAKAVKQDLTDKNNNPIVYSFKHNDQILNAKQKIGECGIKNGDRLTLTSDGRDIQSQGPPQPPVIDKVGDTFEVMMEVPGFTKFKESVSPNTIVQELINKIIQDKKLSSDKHYELFSRHLGRSLLPNSTIGQNSIPPGDLFALNTDAIPGCYFT